MFFAFEKSSKIFFKKLFFLKNSRFDKDFEKNAGKSFLVIFLSFIINLPKVFKLRGKMEIYVEYAFLENLCVDVTVLFLSFYFLKIPVLKRNLIFGGCLGGAFAVVYPLLVVSIPLFATFLKIILPFILCKIAVKGCKIKGEKYILCVVAFYVNSFLFAGGIYALCCISSTPYAYADGIVTTVPFGIILCGMIFIIYIAIYFFKKLYHRSYLTNRLFRCRITYEGRCVGTIGFLDSGNLARKGGKPICFLSPDLFYDLLGERAVEACEEELAIASVAGDKTIKLWKIDELKIYSGKQENIIKGLWISPSYQLAGRDYKLLFGAWAFEEEIEVRT